MLRIVFFSKTFGTHERIEAENYPKIGEQVTLFYVPFPTVIQVVWVMGEDEYCGFSKKNTDIVIIVE